MHVICISISKSFAAIRSPGRPGPPFPSLGSSMILPMGVFSLFPRVGASQAREFQMATTTPSKNCPNDILHRYLHFFPQNPPNPVFFWSVFACFCNVFLQNTVIYTFVATRPFQNIIFTMFPIPLSPQTLEKNAIYQFFHVPMPLANSNIYTKNPSKTLFFKVFFVYMFELASGIGTWKNWRKQCK